jgi:oxygen-independent coproporphyrinogen-3 oxidase
MKADPFKTPSNQAGLYIHIPFCLSKCGYCSFYSIQSVDLIPEYVEALKKEIKYYRKILFLSSSMR